MARLTLEGNSADDDYNTIQKLIKKIIETTRCTQSEAEIALHDNDNDIHAAIDHILDSDKLDSWTDPKAAKKEKKTVNEERAQNHRTFVPRGRGTNGFSDRGGRGRSNGAPREPREPRGEHGAQTNGAPSSTHRGRGGFDRPNTFSGRGGRGGGRGGYSRAVAPESSAPPTAEEVAADPVPKVETVVNEVSKPAAEESVSTTVPASTAPAPISFAAIAARANHKEVLRKQNLTAPTAAPTQQQTSKNVSNRRSVSPVPPAKEVAHSFEEAEPSTLNEEKVESFYQSESSALVEEPEVNVSATNNAENVQSSPAQATAWAKQLKADLGIGVPETSSTSFAPTSPLSANVSLPDPGVEFVGVDPVGLADYSFGYVDQPPTQILPPAETSVASISTNNSDNIFNSTRMSSVPSKSVEPERSQLQNGGNDFNLKSQSPPTSYGQQNRTLSYDTSSVSYNPKERPLSNNNQFNQQLPVHQQPQQQQAPQQQAPQPPQPTPQTLQQQALQQQQQQQQHPMMFPHQNFPYAPYSYMNMYSPVRDDQYAALMQYGMGVDLTNLSTILPQQTAPAPSVTAQQQQAQQQQQQRGNDAHTGLMDFNKFAAQGGLVRDQQQQQPQQAQQQQQPSNVGPPPGFQTTSYMQQPLSSLFMQQPYAAAQHAYQFMNMMPSVGNNGAGNRQMYGQDDERKAYDKKPTAPQNQHSQYPQNLGMYGGGNGGQQQKNKYNWAS
ncbi:unnamed protein product [Caenorhabditis angaria]|uniref:UBA domain-containing protein n=1 Tax=Caenorhabditis angaria TaxID=860376 RepID=A0A9P1MWV0_9PELO|nr:unnamed protein product [Caenorhabditis angaria]